MTSNGCFHFRDPSHNTASSLDEIELYFADRADINDNQGPNEAMRLLGEVRDIQCDWASIAALKNRIAELERVRNPQAQAA